MGENKGVLITIIVLLVIFLPLTVLGYINNKNISNNPNHELFYQNKLWFYDNDELIGTYDCESEDCNIAKSTIDDSEYNINYYDIGSDELKPFSNGYIFIEDNQEILLYDLNTNNTLVKYNKIKTYNTKIPGNLVIVENTENLWGVLSFENNLESIIPFEYDFIGLVKNNDEILTDYFIVKTNDNWNVINKSNEVIGNTYQDIIKNIIVKDNLIGIELEDKIDVYRDNTLVGNVKTESEMAMFS